VTFSTKAGNATPRDSRTYRASGGYGERRSGAPHVFGSTSRESIIGGRERGPYAGVGPRGYQRSDERIREDICEQLTQHGELDCRDTEVTVRDREVTLSGRVESRRARRLAEDIAESVAGVADVHNQLHVGDIDDGGLRGAH
jgi:osmotically-inducible protein OsmY